jgi:apolipoprotein N-acyltransferase
LCSRSAVSPTRNGSIATTARESASALTAPPSAVEARPQGRGLLAVGLALIFGALAGLCFPPFDLGVLIVAPLAGLVWLWRTARPRQAALYGFAFGVGCYGIVLEWVRYFGVVALVPFVAAMAGCVALVGFVVALLARRGVASPWLTAAVWVVVEAIRGRVPLGGFSWADTGVALHNLGVARALASFGGVPLVSFVCVALAAFAVDAAVALRARRTRPLTLALAGLAGLVTVSLVAVPLRFEPRVTSRLRVAMLQGDDRQLTLSAQQRQRLTGAHLALAGRLRGHYDLIVFPEGALDTDPQLDPTLRGKLSAIARRHGSSVLVNARTPATEQADYNSNILYEPDGRYQATYDKQHLVPFGEYVPWRGTLGFISELRQIPYDFKAGHHNVIFHVAGKPIGTVICFESSFGPLVRSVVRDGAQAIVVSTNNRSYRRSGNSEQHLANSQMRAAETARPVLQASLSGISGVIDADGNVHQTTGLFERAIVSTTIATTIGETPYVRFGDWIVLVSVAGLVIAVVLGARRSRAHVRDAPTRGV